MGTYVSSKKWINTEQAELRRVYPNPRLASAVIPPNTPAITSICIRMPLSVRLLLWADLWCVLLSPWDTCIDEFNTRPPTWGTSLRRDVSSPAQPWTDKYQGEQRTCLSYPLHLQWRQNASVTPNCCFSLFFFGNPWPWLQKEVLCGLVWLWLLLALNIGSSQGDWHMHSACPPCAWMTHPSANHIATALKKQNKK